MGFHVILNSHDREMVSHYIETLDELALLDNLTANTIIYQGEPHWTPVALGNSDPCYANYLEDWFCAGINAQRLFRQQAQAHRLIVEDISQDQESFRQYTDVAPGSIKRGDFLIRNARNVEIEVKCRSLLTADDAARTRYHKIGAGEVDKLDQMQRITGVPVLVAFYHRDRRQPREDSLKMITLETLIAATAAGTVWRSDNGMDLCVPLQLMTPGFELVDRIRAAIARGNARGGSWDTFLNDAREQTARQALIQAQAALCDTLRVPQFMPEDGICRHCNGDIVTRFGVELATRHVTGCPLCFHSFCE